MLWGVIVMLECERMSDMAGMMEKMMQGCPPAMMIEMVPECLGMILTKLPEEQRTKMIKKLSLVLLEKGGDGMTEKDKKDLVDKIMGTARV